MPGQGAGYRQSLKRKLVVHGETTHSPEDYGHGHFSTWTQAPESPAGKENIEGLLLPRAELCAMKACVGGRGENEYLGIQVELKSLINPLCEAVTPSKHGFLT